MEPGTTDGPGITAKNRLKAIGGGWDINVTSVLLKHLKPRSVEAYAAMYSSQLATSATDADLKKGQYFIDKFKGGWDKLATFSKSLPEHAGEASIGKMLADMVHYKRVCYSASLEHTSVLDS